MWASSWHRGTNEQTDSFCYVYDLIRGIMTIMETGPNVIGPINPSNPAEFTICELAEELIGSCSKIVHRPLPKMIRKRDGPT